MADVKEKRRGVVKLLTLAAIIGGGILIVNLTPFGGYLSREGILRGVASLRSSSLAPLIFVSVYAVAVGLAIPGVLLTMAGGAVFGLWGGTLFSWLGASIGANLAYLLARFLGREGITQILGEKVEEWPAMERLDRAVETHGFRGMLILRMVPVAPFTALNFLGGLVGMSWPSYALSTGLGIIPGTFVYTMFADALLQGSTEASREAYVRLAIAGSLLVFLSFLPMILKKFRLAVPELAEEEEEEEGNGDSV